MGIGVEFANTVGQPPKTTTSQAGGYNTLSDGCDGFDPAIGISIHVDPLALHIILQRPDASVVIPQFGVQTL